MPERAPLATPETVAEHLTGIEAGKAQAVAVAKSAKAAQREAQRIMRAAYGPDAYGAAYDDAAAREPLEEAEALLCAWSAAARGVLHLSPEGGAVRSVGFDDSRQDFSSAGQVEAARALLHDEAERAIHDAATIAGVEGEATTAAPRRPLLTGSGTFTTRTRY